MRPVAAVLAALIAVLGLGVAVPGLTGTASACTCGATGPVPTDLVVIAGVVEKQLVGGRYTDVQVRVTSMYGAPPERVTVVRAESSSYSSCGSDFTDGGEFRMVVERDGGRWTYPTCANVWLGKLDEQGMTGVPPGADAPENRLPGPPISWLIYLTRPDTLIMMVLGAAVILILLLAIWPRLRRRRT